MNSDHPYEPPCHQILNGPPCQGSIDPETLGEHGRGDLLVLGNLGEQLVVGGLVEEHRVVDLLLLLTLAPLLLLLLPASGLSRLGRRRRGLILLRGHGGGVRRATERRAAAAGGARSRRRTMRTSRPTSRISRLTPAIRIWSSGKGLTTMSSRSSPSPPRGLSQEMV